MATQTQKLGLTKPAYSDPADVQVFNDNMDIIDEFAQNAKFSVQVIEGTNLTIANTEEAKLRGLHIYGRTTQKGTPAPNAPIPLENVGGDGEIVTEVRGTNLFCKSEIVSGQGLGSGGAAYSDATYCYSEAISVKEGFAYSTQNVSWCNFYTDNGTPTASNFVSQIVEKFLVVPSGAKYVRLCVSLSKIDIAMLNEGSTTLPYQLGTKQQIITTIPNGICGIPVTSGGNYTDQNGQQWICDEIDFERGVLIKRTNTITFKGTENFITLGLAGDANAFFYQVDSSVKPFVVDNEGFSLCSHFENKRIISSTTDIGHQVRKISNGDQYRILLRPEGVANMTGSPFMQWLKENPTTVTYALATSTEIPLSAEDIAEYKKLHTNYPTTIITDADGAYMAVKYIARGAMPSNTTLADMMDDENHRLVSDEDIAKWNGAPDTYATKAELESALGYIETALASI